MNPATHLDLYQLTSLIPHWDAQRAHADVWMSFFSRRLPQSLGGAPVRSWIVWAGLHRCLEWLQDVHFDAKRIETLLAHPMLGPALSTRPDLVETLREWRFRGEIWAPREGEILKANVALDERGHPLDFGGVKPSAMPPYLQVRTDLLTAKLIETPLLSIINHMSMIATKASHLCQAAAPRPILEFGTRRTHIEGAVDAAIAAYLGGVKGTSNVEAHHRYGIPVLGTMDHFAVQAWECPESSIAMTERAFFSAFIRTYPDRASLLVDTYDMFGEETGIRNAVSAAQALGVSLDSIRIDSALSVETLERARALLDQLGAPEAKIIASGGVDHDLICKLREAPVDVYGVGERLVTSADAPVGVGAVGKLSWIEGETSMKRAQGSGKATLPGPIQALRGPQGDRLVLVKSKRSISPESRYSFAWDDVESRLGEVALIDQVWGDRTPRGEGDPHDWLDRARNYCADQIKALGISSEDQSQEELKSCYLDLSMISEINSKLRGS